MSDGDCEDHPKTMGDGGGDKLLAVKENQPTLASQAREIRETFAAADNPRLSNRSR